MHNSYGNIVSHRSVSGSFDFVEVGVPVNTYCGLANLLRTRLRLATTILGISQIGMIERGKALLGYFD